MAITRLDVTGIGQALGAEAAALLTSRVRGGQAAHKGVRFEHFFAAHRVARLARKYLRDGEDACVEWQAETFVDDVVVRRDARASFKGYQLKNAEDVSWTSGKHPIRDDFLLQKQVCDAEGYTDVRLRVVCSDAAVANAMRRTVPTEILNFGGVFPFPYSQVAMTALMEHAWLSEDFGYLSRAETPTTIQAEQIAALLMGAIATLGNRACVSTILQKAREVSPTLLRTCASDDEVRKALLPEMAELMDGWADFAYVIIKGFLTWTAFGGTTSGTLSFDCLDPRFLKWQQSILAQRPLTFEQVEGVFA